MAEPRRQDISVRREKAILVAVVLRTRNAPPSDDDAPAPERTDTLGELRSLAETAGAVVVDQLIQHRSRPESGTFIGTGKLQDLAELVRGHEADVVIFDNDLSPAQLRNIEEVAECKVLDRSELILDIFAGRARTHEAKLQVELAQLQYTYPRLRAMWSHLERIVGGTPVGIGTRGPGEQQLEVDRRIVQRRTAELRREIDRIQDRKRRQIKQRNADFFTVGLVGYTNAGKTTLFNTLTDAGAYADDKLFATLDTRTRRWELGGGDHVMLCDTVGFIRRLPHHLVASFKATLEESVNADLLLLLVDISDPDAEQHLTTVLEVLEQIGADVRPRLLVLNKVDRLADNAPRLVFESQHPDALSLSALTAVGLNELVEAVRQRQRGEVCRLTVRVPLADGKTLNFLENRAEVHDRRYDNSHVTMDLTIGRRQLDQLRATGASFDVIEPPE